MIETITTSLEMFAAIMNNGGLVMWVLFFLNLMLWYGLGYRRLTLRRGTMWNVRLLVNSHLKKGLKRKREGIIDYAIVDALQAASDARAVGKKPRNYIQDALWPYLRSINRYSTLVKTIVVLAPLIGLLGTVSGMIATFRVIEYHGAGNANGLAGGISEALITTQSGLVVAVPGLIMGNLIQRRVERLKRRLDAFGLNLLEGSPAGPAGAGREEGGHA